MLLIDQELPRTKDLCLMGRAFLDKKIQNLGVTKEKVFGRVLPNGLLKEVGKTVLVNLKAQVYLHG